MTSCLTESYTFKNLSLKSVLYKNARVLFMNCNNVVITDKTRMQMCRYLLVPPLKEDELTGYLGCMIQQAP
jgi:hypothetical protein